MRQFTFRAPKAIVQNHDDLFKSMGLDSIGGKEEVGYDETTSEKRQYDEDSSRESTIRQKKKKAVQEQPPPASVVPPEPKPQRKPTVEERQAEESSEFKIADSNVKPVESKDFLVSELEKVLRQVSKTSTISYSSAVTVYRILQLPESEENIKRMQTIVEKDILVGESDPLLKTFFTLFRSWLDKRLQLLLLDEEPAPVADTVVVENIYAKMITALNDIAKRALQPLVLFSGMVSQKLHETDERLAFVYKKNNPTMDERLEVFDKNTTTREQFLATIRDAGPNFTSLFLTMIMEESARQIQELEEKPTLINSCFDLDELDKDVEDISHPALFQSELRKGVKADENQITLLEAEANVLKEQIRSAKARPVEETVRLQEARIAAKQREIEAAVAARNPATSQAVLLGMRRSLSIMQENLVVLRRDTTDFILRLEDEYHNMLNRIVEHKRNITNRHQLNEVRATITAIGMSETERQFAPAWAFECMGSAIFRRVLNTTSLAAYEVALAHVNRIPGCASFTMKELICSPGVSDMFAFLVAANFLSSGDGSDHTDTRAFGGGGGRRRTYLNVTKVRDILAAKVMTCKIWFESVVRRPNPLVAQFAAKLAEKKRKGHNDPVWLKRMETYQKMLPQYVLVYVE